MPVEGEVTKFKSFKETVKIPFVIYADLEALLHKLIVSQKHEMEQDQTEKIQKHVSQKGYKLLSCNCSFTAENNKVRDHCHVTGNYRGASCDKCNLGMKLSRIIPVIFHNLKGYDSHLLL